MSGFTTSINPESRSHWLLKPLVHGKKGMIVTNNRWASEAAKMILTHGGNAVDASIAATFVLGVTEPQSSGLGGGGYALTYQPHQQRLYAYDGRERAPASATPDLFLDQHGQPIDFPLAMLSARSTGIPGEVAMLYLMHQKEGRLPWKTLLQPAIARASQGFPMTPRLHTLLTEDQAILVKSEQIKSIYFNTSGQVKPLGDRVINKPLAETLKLIADNPAEFYHGKIAQDILVVLNQKSGKHLYQLDDFKQYQAILRPALCDRFRHYKLCTVSPSAGGIAVIELLKLYAARYLGRQFDDVKWVYTFLEASKLMFADRNQYLADPAFVKQPIAGLLDDNYIQTRSHLISDNAMQGKIKPGRPRGVDVVRGADTQFHLHGTTSLTIVDAKGNAVAMTVTIEHQFGNHIMVDGFFLNNELTDFSFVPQDNKGRWIANRVESLKRPRSSIAPIMIFNQGQLQALTASPGGTPILCYVAKNIIQLLDFNWTPQQSVTSGNLCVIGEASVIEAHSDLISFIPALKKRGEIIETTDRFISGMTTIKRDPQGGWWGAADPRREGVAEAF
ncbi:MAG: gamma-glutamyltransferase family protein [Legionellaceae bacterium]|nr:gamma-glutamyltransferase family protein [Legionellaceae bacterium]